MLDHLLSPIKIRNLELKNRCVIPPMGTNLGNRDGTVTEKTWPISNGGPKADLVWLLLRLWAFTLPVVSDWEFMMTSSSPV